MWIFLPTLEEAVGLDPHMEPCVFWMRDEVLCGWRSCPRMPKFLCITDSAYFSLASFICASLSLLPIISRPPA